MIHFKVCEAGASRRISSLSQAGVNYQVRSARDELGGSSDRLTLRLLWIWLPSDSSPHARMALR